MKSGKLGAWYQAGRPPFFVATLIPLVLGGVVAHLHGGWNTTRWLVVLFASFLVHLSTNLANDYYDHKSGADAGQSIGGSRVVQEGKITPEELCNAMILFYGAAALCGLWILWDSGVWWLLPLMLFSFCSSLFYTAPPIRYGYLGLGELAVGINMGPVMVVGCAAALSGRLLPQAIWLSVPVGIMVASILFYQSLSDIEPDLAVGKLTLAARLGKRGAIRGMRLFMIAALGSVAALVAAGALNPVVLLSLVTVVPAFQVDRMIRRTRDWKELHDRGGKVRLIYLINGTILIVAAAMSKPI